ncbi:helix-turn-helix domain-containing protein [Streptomyces europaeiscabiei]|uniref:helix-turn-helix domain-containing protein n=1 Tax=Streptomyces europaeiscabiei TaxID=146819 RepID=UPI00099BC23E|nr:helix-turn-helix domain-containing protein [Streptomyces europaeiscabiei]
MNSGEMNSPLPKSYSAAEVAAALDCSEWWVKEQARRRRIPFLRSGSGYRFTRSHVEEIFHILEERPDPVNVPQIRSASTRPRTFVPFEVPAPQLTARRPRRMRNAV